MFRLRTTAACDRSMLSRLGIVLLLGVLVGGLSCANAPTTSTPPATTQKTIVVTYSILGSIVRDLVGDNATVIVPMPNGRDPHDWEPSAKDIETLNKADLIVQNGLGLEGGMEKTLEQAEAGGVKTFTASDHITVINNGVDRDHFSPDGPRVDRDPGLPLIVCVGRLSEQKGQDLAIRALARLRDQSARLRLVGSDSTGGERERLEALAVSLGVADRIEWRGHVTDSAPELRTADLVIAPSRWEGMSLVFLEAMACGAAMVVADVSGSEVVDGAGVIVPREDPQALAEAIAALLEDAPLRRRLGEAARERSRSYDLGSTMLRNMDLWSDLASEATRSPSHRVHERG